nr:DUF6188 family protein [Streptomyces sp. VRA16 Mangrove soil]
MDRQGRRLPVTGLAVRQVRVDRRLTLVLDTGAQIVVAGPARLALPDSGPETVLAPAAQQVAAALALFGAETDSAVVRPDGRLVVEFAGGARLTVPPAQDASGASGASNGAAWSVLDADGNPLT